MIMQQNIRFEPLAPSISVSSVSVTSSSSSALVVLRLTARSRPSTPAPEITTRGHSITMWTSRWGEGGGGWRKGVKNVCFWLQMWSLILRLSPSQWPFRQKRIDAPPRIPASYLSVLDILQFKICILFDFFLVWNTKLAKSKIPVRVVQKCFCGFTIL